MVTGIELLLFKALAGKGAAVGAAKLGAGAVGKTVAAASAKTAVGTAATGNAKHQAATSFASGAAFPERGGKAQKKKR